MDTHSYSNIPASCLGAGNGRHHEASAEDPRRYAQALALSLSRRPVRKQERLLVGSVWNLDAVEATLTKARAKGQTFDKDCYASPSPSK
ncbi:unnamed protein product [Sphagnum balticum]